MTPLGVTGAVTSVLCADATGVGDPLRAVWQAGEVLQRRDSRAARQPTGVRKWQRGKRVRGVVTTAQPKFRQGQDRLVAGHQPRGTGEFAQRVIGIGTPQAETDRVLSRSRH